MILKSETYHFHRLDLTRQAGFIVTIYDEDGLSSLPQRRSLLPPKLSARRERSSTIKSRDRENRGDGGFQGALVGDHCLSLFPSHRRRFGSGRLGPVLFRDN